MKHIAVISRKPPLAQEFTLGQTLTIAVNLLNAVGAYFLVKPDVPTEDKTGTGS